VKSAAILNIRSSVIYEGGIYEEYCYIYSV